MENEWIDRIFEDWDEVCCLREREGKVRRMNAERVDLLGADCFSVSQHNTERKNIDTYPR